MTTPVASHQHTKCNDIVHFTVHQFDSCGSLDWIHFQRQQLWTLKTEEKRIKRYIKVVNTWQEAWQFIRFQLKGLAILTAVYRFFALLLRRNVRSLNEKKVSSNRKRRLGRNTRTFQCMSKIRAYAPWKIALWAVSSSTGKTKRLFLVQESYENFTLILKVRNAYFSQSWAWRKWIAT